MSCNDEDVYLDNGYTFTASPMQADDATGVLSPVRGITTMTGYFAATSGGAAIASTTVDLTERTSAPGEYFGTLARSLVASALGAYVGQTVYRVIDDGVSARETVPVTVYAVRAGT